MEKVGAYREYADECRRLAKQMKDPGNVNQLRQIAKAWEDLAADRERRLRERGVISNRPDADGKPRIQFTLKRPAQWVARGAAPHEPGTSDGMTREPPRIRLVSR